MQYSQLQGRQRGQNSILALYAPRTWLVSLGTVVISSLLLAIALAFLHIVSPTSFVSLFSTFSGRIVFIPLLLFFLALSFALFTNQSSRIRAYQQALKKHLATSMNSYYSPEGALTLQEYLKTLMRGHDLRQKQERHLLVLGGPGSGKTANLKYAVYQAVSSKPRKINKLPVLIQMKYYDGFLRNLRVTAPGSGEASTETLLAYLLDSKHAQKSQTGKEAELIGLHHLRSYLPQLVRQGRIAFLCDGMNELESDALATIHGELTHLMQTTQNTVIMTCRELEYQEQELLKDLANNGVTIKMLPPLTEKDVTEIVKTYLQSQQPLPGAISLNDAEIEEAQERVCELSQSYREISPFLLMMLIQALKNPEIQARAFSRGHLLRLSVDQRPLIHEPEALIFGDHPEAQNVRGFLSAVACTARRNGQRNAIQLVKDIRFTTSSQLQDFLNVWLSDNEVDVSNFTQANIGKFLRIALDASLITISNNGVLSFIHELVAEYFAAEYLRFIFHRNESEDESFWYSIYESEVSAAGLWSEPIAIWAGLEDQPKEIARFLMTNIDHYCLQEDMDEAVADLYHYHALALSLGCLGVQMSEGLPDEIFSYLKQSMLVKERHEQLAMIFKRCADEGGIEVYQALLPYIHIPGLLDVFLKIHDLYRDKENSTILAMLFEWLEKVVAHPIYADQTQALITLLGEIGRRGDETVRQRARSLTEASQLTLLRAAAINILELLRNPNDVPLLIKCLYAADKEVIGSAISATRIFGPEFTLALLEREESEIRDQAYAQTRLNLLRVLEGFLLETSPQQSPIAPRQMQTLIALIIRFLSTFDKEPTWLLARDLLNGQLQKNPEDASLLIQPETTLSRLPLRGHLAERKSLVTNQLLDTIDTEDQTQAEHIQEILRTNCLHVLETIIDYWNTRKRREKAWERIIFVLGRVSDTSILAFLLQQLDEPALSLQDELSTALSLQQESTEPLLQAVLAPTATQHVIQVVGKALRQIGGNHISAICDELLNIRSHAEATEAGLQCLVQMLDQCSKNGQLSARMEGKVVRGLTTLFNWLIENAPRHAQLTAEMIPVMANFHDHRVVSVLLKVMGRPGVLLVEEIPQEAIKGLSQLGEYAVDSLIEALDSPKETLLTRRARQVLLEMVPFPRAKLLLTFTGTRSAAVQQVQWIFLANQQDTETIRFLIKHLLESSDDSPMFDNIQQTLAAMQPDYTMPYLIEILGQPHWQAIKPFLRACPQPEIILPLLIRDLTDLQRYSLVLEILQDEFDYPAVLPWLIPSLANEHTRQSTRQLIEKMACTYDGDLLPDIVRLFDPTIARPEPLPDSFSEVQSTLQELLTRELEQKSLPALVMGLAEPSLRESCVDSLVTLAHIQYRQEEVLQAVLHALRHPSQRLGAHQTLVKCGKIAARLVCELVRESDLDLVREARTILAKMGDAAFPYIYQLAHDPQHRAHAQDILPRIPVETISKGLLACFTSDDRQKEEIAFYLLAMAIDGENNSQPGNSSLIGELLAQTLELANDDVCLRTLGALLFFARGRRPAIAQHLVRTIIQTPEKHFRVEYLRLLFLLGKDAVDPLTLAMHTPDLSEAVRLEMISTLSSLAEDEQVTEYVRILAAGTGSNKTVSFLHRALGLRALGGLLAGGVYHEKKLAKIRDDLRASSKPQDRDKLEFFDVLLGQRNLPELVSLQETINRQQADIDRLNKLTRNLEDKLARTKQATLPKLLNRR